MNTDPVVSAGTFLEIPLLLNFLLRAPLKKPISDKAFLAAVFVGVTLSRVLEFLFFPLVFSGFSIHVGQIALLVLVFSATLLYAGSPTVWLWASLAASLDQMTFLIIDQISYYALVDITDEAYFGPASLAGTLAASGLSTGLLLWHRQRR